MKTDEIREEKLVGEGVGFERIRRIILDKEIAEYLGISSSNFNKIRDKLIDFVWEKFEEVYKREQE